MVGSSLSETSQVSPSSQSTSSTCSNSPQVDTSADSASGPPLPSRLSTPSTAPKTKRDSLCQDQSWPMLISKESSKPTKSKPP